MTHFNAAAPASGGERSRPRLSIVVLPFTNLSDDRDQRNTAFTYTNKPIDTKQIGRELGVRYVLEGSVRRSDSRVRIAAQLIDAESDAHLWAERFDRDTGDLLALQIEITSQFANTLGAELVAVEAARSTDNPDARDYMLRGRAAALKPTSRDGYADMISLFERALVLDPQSVEAQTRLASALANRALIGVTDSAAGDIARAEELVDRALAASPRYAPAILPKAMCCAHRADAQRPFPNTRRCSRPIATR